MRKQPRQKRSQAMVDDILEATMISVARHGLEATTTRRVAEIAGISVGSLYQYFQDKEELFEAVQERMTEAVLQRVVQVIPTLPANNLRESVRILLYSVADLLDEKDGRYLALLREWNQVGMRTGVERIESKMMEIIGMQAAGRWDRSVVRRLPLISYVLINAVIFNLVRYFAAPSPYFSRADLIDALADLVSAQINSAPGTS